MKNGFEIRGDVTAIFLRRKDGSVLETLIDTADLPIAQSFPKSWCVANCQGRLYVHGWLSRGKGSTIRLHRLILGAPSNPVDHADHNTLDNRRANLRACSPRENSRNSVRSSCNTSGYKGVSLDRKRGSYRAMIKTEDKHVFLGRFKTADEAAVAYDKAAMKLFGPFANCNLIGC